jgi:DNA-binding CsgD family transcriptional regulator
MEDHYGSQGGRRIDDDHKLDWLTGQIFQAVMRPEMLPEVIDGLEAWIRSTSESGFPDLEVTLERELLSTRDSLGATEGPLDGNKSSWRRIIDLLLHYRSLREFSDPAASWAHTSHVFGIFLTQNGRIFDCAPLVRNFLKASKVLRIVGGQLCCASDSFQLRFNAAFCETVDTGRTTNILLHAQEKPEKRFSLTFTRMLQQPSPANGDAHADSPGVLCLVAPLDRRRVATARQLMDLFGLSGAEVRLARALCIGESVEEYALDQGLRLPTVRTQLRSVFSKTGTERQTALVRLIAGIPVVRDPA